MAAEYFIKDEAEREKARARMRAEFEEENRLAEKLLQTIKARLPELEKTLTDACGHWQAEDGFYRYYHGSFKVYGLQAVTDRVVATLRSLLPERELNKWFLDIIGGGTGKTFEPGLGRNWHVETRPILEAFFHARAMLEYAVKYGRELETAPQMLPSGWAAVLYLYGIR
jgi:hypothetical protein